MNRIARLGLALAAALWLAPAAHAASTADSPAGTVTTHATARRRLPNTVADVTVAIEADAADTAGVGQRLADGSQALLAYLRGAGAERLRSDMVSVEPVRGPGAQPGPPGPVTGYRGTLAVSFRTQAPRLAELVAGSLSHGANSLEQAGFAPREEEAEAARQDLAAEAARKAVALADAVAKAVGRTVRGVRHLAVDPGPGMPSRGVRVFAADRAAPAAFIGTEAGESEVAATVDVTVDLAGPP